MAKSKKSVLNKFANFIIFAIGAILLLGLIVNFFSGLSESATVSLIRSGNAINPPGEEIRLGTRQLKFVEEVKQDILLSEERFNEIKAISGDRAGADERRKRAKQDLYAQRELVLASLTTPLNFSDFTGVLDSIDTSTVVGGPNSGAKKITLKVRLFGSGIILEDHMLLDEGGDPINTPDDPAWTTVNAEGNPIGWFDLNGGDSISLSGAFVRYSEETQWAHCCFSSVDWPLLRIDLRSVQRLEQ